MLIDGYLERERKRNIAIANITLEGIIDYIETFPTGKEDLQPQLDELVKIFNRNNNER